jgi:hypothetical protein
MVPSFFGFANQFVYVLRQPPLRSGRVVQVLPSLRTPRQPTEYPIAQRTEIRLGPEQELLIRVVRAADHEATDRHN